jgi:hypothetical protein
MYRDATTEIQLFCTRNEHSTTEKQTLKIKLHANFSSNNKVKKSASLIFYYISIYKYQHHCQSFH